MAALDAGSQGGRRSILDGLPDWFHEASADLQMPRLHERPTRIRVWASPCVLRLSGAVTIDAARRGAVATHRQSPRSRSSASWTDLTGAQRRRRRRCHLRNPQQAGSRRAHRLRPRADCGRCATDGKQIRRGGRRVMVRTAGPRDPRTTNPASPGDISCINQIDVIASGGARAKPAPGDDVSRVQYGTFWHQHLDDERSRYCPTTR